MRMTHNNSIARALNQVHGISILLTMFHWHHKFQEGKGFAFLSATWFEFYDITSNTSDSSWKKSKEHRIRKEQLKNGRGEGERRRHIVKEQQTQEEKKLIQRLIKRSGMESGLTVRYKMENSAKLCTLELCRSLLPLHRCAGQYSVVKLRNTGREFNLNILLAFS